MEAAKDKISSFLHKGSKEDTTVHESVKPSVTEEIVKPHRHEEVHKAVDKEVHQDHYHTTVQPIQDKQVLPEKHTLREGAVENREFHHGGNDAGLKEKAAAEAARFKNTTQTQSTTHSSNRNAEQVGEHVHHHVHETVQPVINKETIAPEVVHTIKPIHETHILGSQSHGTSVLPTKSIGEFEREGGLTGKDRHHGHEKYDGPPRQYNPEFQSGTGTSGQTGTSNRQI